MFCLVYRSVANPSFREDQIQEMLKKARQKNDRLGITGCLLYFNGQFIQYLEGNQIRVLELFDEIKKDKRHYDVELLSYGERDSREFKNWDMAYEDLYGENDQIAYLKLQVNSYLEEPYMSLAHHPSSLPFWQSVSQLINTPA